MARLTVEPAVGPLDAVVRVPGSKSIANRAIACAVLAEGASAIEGVPDGDDTRRLIEACVAMGATIRVEGASVAVEHGIDRASPEPVRVDAGLGGTTSRFLTALAALRSGSVTVSGDHALRRRPMADLHGALRAIGAGVEWHEGDGELPVTISGGPVAGGSVEVSGGTSSQFASAMLLAGPAMRDGLRLVVPPPRVSAGYLEMSVEVARAFGASVEVLGNAIAVRSGGYRGRRYAVEPDASSASFVFAAAALVGGRIVVPGLGAARLQPELAFARVLGRMGCTVESTGADLAVSREPGAPLRGVEVDMSEMSDAVPVLAAVATRATGPTRITGVGFIRGKESNRIEGLAQELRKIGASVEVESDGFIVEPGRPVAATIDSLDDHRIAMSFGVLGLVGGPVTVVDPSVVDKSWPAFWDVLGGLAATS